MRRATLLTIGTLGVAAGCLTPTSGTVRGIGHSGGGSTALLAFSGEPSNAVAGQIITPAVQVTARDTLGVTDSAFTGNVSVAIGTNPVAGNLGGTTSVPVVNGVARFADLTIDKAGSGYTLSAQAQGAASATSTAFDITARAPAPRHP